MGARIVVQRELAAVGEARAAGAVRVPGMAQTGPSAHPITVAAANGALSARERPR
jgi:hypothetical protein